jgi:hypothetical protein
VSAARDAIVLPLPTQPGGIPIAGLPAVFAVHPDAQRDNVRYRSFAQGVCLAGADRDAQPSPGADLGEAQCLEGGAILGGIHLPALRGTLLAQTHVVQVISISSEVHPRSLTPHTSKFRIFALNSS